MKKRLVISFFLILTSISGFAQDKEGEGLFTDREMYVSGENLLAMIYLPESNGSRMVRLDLVNQHGTWITGVSAEIKNNRANGFLLLPDSLSSGTYLLRAYLKNTTSKFKIIREIWVSNRFNGLEKTLFINRVTGMEPLQEREHAQIEITAIEPEYATKSQIIANIKIDETLVNDIEGELLVCVAQADSAFKPASYLWNSDQGKEGFAEKNGIIVSGTVADKNTLLPASGITVYLTIPDSIPGFQYYQTRHDGRFYFLLDKYYGPVEAFVQCFGTASSQRLRIKMDELFAESGSLPAFGPEPVPEAFKNSSVRNIEAVTIQKIFDQRNLKFLPPPASNGDSYPYYGKPSQTVDPQLFIDLPDFNEISKELLPGVKFRNYNYGPTMKVINAGTRNYFDEEPLLLIDGIPVRDLNVIKNMGTPDIERIDICQSERFYGDLRFPGVVAIYTTKADYSMLPVSDQLVRMKLETIQVPVILTEPVLQEETIPDLRQVLFWNPSVEAGKTLSVKCRTSSIVGRFRLIVRGKLKDGTLIFSEKQFQVK